MYFDVNPSPYDIHDLAVVYWGKDVFLDAGVFSKIDTEPGAFYQPWIFKKEKCLDVGCGYGPGLASLAKAGVAVTMVDVNERALDLAKKNASEMAWKHSLSSDVYEAVERVFDHVISNPPIRAGKRSGSEVITGSLNI